MCKLVRHLMVGRKASTQWKSDLLYISSCIKHHACFKHLSKSSSLAVWWEFKKISFKSSLITCKNPFEKIQICIRDRKNWAALQRDIQGLVMLGGARAHGWMFWHVFVTCSFGGCGRGWGCSTRYFARWDSQVPWALCLLHLWSPCYFMINAHTHICLCVCSVLLCLCSWQPLVSYFFALFSFLSFHIFFPFKNKMLLEQSDIPETWVNLSKCVLRLKFSLEMFTSKD